MDKVSSNNDPLKVSKSSIDFLNWVFHPSTMVLVPLDNEKFEIMKICNRNYNGFSPISFDQYKLNLQLLLTHIQHQVYCHSAEMPF